MFTGIVQGIGTILAIETQPGYQTHEVEIPEKMLSGLIPGASVAHNGCCLTVTSIIGAKARFDLVSETLKVTNLATLNVGDKVNLERAARFGDEIGGHMLSGHIIGTAHLVQLSHLHNSLTLWFEVPQHLARYLFSKGYIGLDGISLTLGEVKGNRFCVHLIPETIARTTIGTRVLGDRLNVEIDTHTQVIVDSVERLVSQYTNSNR